MEKSCPPGLELDRTVVRVADLLLRASLKVRLSLLIAAGSLLIEGVEGEQTGVAAQVIKGRARSENER